MYKNQRRIKELTPYIPAVDIFRIYEREPGAAFLDSSLVNELGHYSVIGRCPYLKLVKDGGFLATCSCSHFMSYELFTQTIAQAAKSVHKRIRQVEYRTQAPDHPILWAADESYYLKFYIFQVCEEK